MYSRRQPAQFKIAIARADCDNLMSTAVEDSGNIVKSYRFMSFLSERWSEDSVGGDQAVQKSIDSESLVGAKIA